jgi:phosphoglycolate phosphatase-like HAD superfamily hydrolase
VPAPKLLALDFDGVICDTAREGFRSSWEVCRELGIVQDAMPPAAVAAAFVRARPVLEYGWEFPVLALALLDGAQEADLFHDFPTWRRRTMEKHHLTREDLMRRFDSVRDRAITANIDAWLADQGLYPGVAERLRSILREPVTTYIITTKEGRFAHKLLEVNGVQFPAAQVWGKEQARPKPELLRVLAKMHTLAFQDIWFVEDRLKTLQSVEQDSGLDAVGLFFATWGYTTPAERTAAADDPRIVPLTLDRFAADFSAWTR